MADWRRSSSRADSRAANSSRSCARRLDSRLFQSPTRAGLAPADAAGVPAMRQESSAGPGGAPGETVSTS
jgi:hypothetical protein